MTRTAGCPSASRGRTTVLPLSVVPSMDGRAVPGDIAPAATDRCAQQRTPVAAASLILPRPREPIELRIAAQPLEELVSHRRIVRLEAPGQRRAQMRERSLPIALSRVAPCEIVF